MGVPTGRSRPPRIHLGGSDWPLRLMDALAAFDRVLGGDAEVDHVLRAIALQAELLMETGLP